MRKFFQFFYQLIWNTLDRSCFWNFSNYSTEYEILPVANKTEIVHSKYPNLLQISTENLCQLEFSPNKDLFITKLMKNFQLNQWLLKKWVLKKWKNINTVFQPQTQTTSVILNPNINSTETKESISPTELTAISIPTSRTLIPVPQYYCKVLQKLLEEVLIFLVIQNHLKNLYRKIILLVQLLINWYTDWIKSSQFFWLKEKKQSTAEKISLLTLAFPIYRV